MKFSEKSGKAHSGLSVKRQRGKRSSSESEVQNMRTETKVPERELIDTLIAISVLSRRLAEKLTMEVNDDVENERAVAGA